MRLSITVSADDIVFLDAFAERSGLDSRSAAVQQAIALLRADQLIRDYATAFDEWVDSGDSDTWDIATLDGLTS